MSKQAERLTPAKTATYAATITPSTATDVTVVAGQIVEATAIDAITYICYDGDASATNFDEFVNIGCTRHYEVPTGCTALSFLSTGSVVVIVK